ncbi:electron transport complex subunit RsxG [Niveibacterium sp.]|uniref:electron transport complex subunit RsxG n=1 Tax=Niveibacterium sp. TaxID=2017444 RepID=UPI0035AEEA67
MNVAALREGIGYQGVLLALFSTLTAAALVVANGFTAPAIHIAEEQDLEASLRQVLPAGFNDNNLLTDVVVVKDSAGLDVEVHKASKAGVQQGAVFKTSSIGYAGPIVILVGISRDGVVQGVRVLRHAETPGLGDKIEVAKSDWVHAFEGKALTTARWLVKKDGGDFDQFAGATITPRGVVKAVKEALAFHQANHAAIYAEH